MSYWAVAENYSFLWPWVSKDRLGKQPRFYKLNNNNNLYLKLPGWLLAIGSPDGSVISSKPVAIWLSTFFSEWEISPNKLIIFAWVDRRNKTKTVEESYEVTKDRKEKPV